MRPIILVLVGLLCGCASGPAVRARDPRALEDDRATAAMLREITARSLKGEGAAIRADLAEQQKHRPNDGKLALYAAWTRAPSEDAWQEIAALAKLHSEDPWPLLCSARIYMQWRGFADQAEAELTRVLKTWPGLIAARTGQADVLRLKGQLAQAKAAYEAVLAEAPDWHDALAGRALTLAEMKDPGARAALEAALASDANDVAVLVALARLTEEEGDAAAAIPLLNRVAELYARDRDVRVRLARMQQSAGDLPAAAAAYESALALSANAEIARALAALYQQLGKVDEEKRTLGLVAQLDGSDVAGLRRLAALHREEGDVHGAELVLRQASERAPEDGGIHLAIARLAREREDWVAAIEAYRRAVRWGAEEAQPELEALESSALLTGKPLAGDPNRVYALVSARLNKKYRELQKTHPRLGGKLAMRVTIDGSGKATLVETLENSLRHGILTALVHFSLKDAQYPKAERTAVFEFTLQSR